MSYPGHVAIIMDGNGRWAKQRKLPRAAGHRAGVEAVRKSVRFAANSPIHTLTLFAFSSENWRRPQKEVNQLMRLFFYSLKKEIKLLHQNNIKIKFIGDLSVLDEKLKHIIQNSENLTQDNTALNLIIALNYGGHWDITQACQKIIDQNLLVNNQITEELILENLSTAPFSNPDLLIRTSGEQRMSNFLVWQLAYTELYFTESYWPDFNEQAFQQAIDCYESRQRRFGHTQEQLEPAC